MLIRNNLHKKNSDVSIKTRSTPASLSFIGQVTKHTTVIWSVVSCSDKYTFPGADPDFHEMGPD